MRVQRLQRHASRQYACFTFGQARAAGYPERTIEWLVAQAHWHELAPNVFCAAPRGKGSWQQWLMALTLAVDGVAFGQSAAALYGLLPPPKQPEVLVVRKHRNRLGTGVHSTRSLPATDVAKVAGIPATMPARTIIDAAATLSNAAVVRLVDKAVVTGRTRPETLWRRAAELQNSKRPGCRKVLEALSSQHPALVSARNEWEAQLLRLIAGVGLPAPVPNYALVLNGQRRFLDVAWPEYMVDLEFDGFEPHMVRAVFDDDRVRQNSLVAAGWTVFRITSRILEEDPSGVLAAIKSTIKTRGHENRNILRIA